jgi:hypothetical protein
VENGLKVGTHWATNRCNTSQRQISSCEQENFSENVVAATLHEKFVAATCATYIVATNSKKYHHRSLHSV